MGKTLDMFTEPNTLFAYGFGDAASQDHSVFNITGEENVPCFDFRQGMCDITLRLSLFIALR